MERKMIEQIVIVKMIRETLYEMQEELYEVGDPQALKGRSHLLAAYVILGAWLAMKGHEERRDPPTPPDDDMPF